MERAAGERPQSPKRSFLATLRDSQAMLLSVRQRWSFRRSPTARGAPGPGSLEEGSSPAQEGEFSQQVLHGTQVSAIAEGRKSWGGAGRGGGLDPVHRRRVLPPEGGVRVRWGRGVARERMNAALRPPVRVGSPEVKSVVDESWVFIASYFQDIFICLWRAKVFQNANQTKTDLPHLFLKNGYRILLASIF